MKCFEIGLYVRRVQALAQGSVCRFSENKWGGKSVPDSEVELWKAVTHKLQGCERELGLESLQGRSDVIDGLDDHFQCLRTSKKISR